MIGLAMAEYAETYGCFPPAYIPDANGRPKHSWRVLLLPFLELDDLYEQYNFDEPWDSPKNLALRDTINPIYFCPSELPSSGTGYLMVVGPGTISDGPTANKWGAIERGDGLSRTIMVVEVANSGIHWMEPRDLKVEEISYAINDAAPRGIRSGHLGGANVLFCDGSTCFLPDTTDPSSVKAMTTINGGEIIAKTRDRPEP